MLIEPDRIPRVVHRDGAVVLHLAGEIDLATGPVAEHHAELAHRAATTSERHLLIIDMTEVDFLASVGVGLLAEHRHRATTTGIGLTLVAANPAVLRILHLTALDGLFTIHATLDEALTAAG